MDVTFTVGVVVDSHHDSSLRWTFRLLVGLRPHAFDAFVVADLTLRASYGWCWLVVPHLAVVLAFTDVYVGANLDLYLDPTIWLFARCTVVDLRLPVIPFAPRYRCR